MKLIILFLSRKLRSPFAKNFYEFFFQVGGFQAHVPHHLLLPVRGGEVARQILNFFKITSWNTAYYHVVAHSVNALVVCVPESHVSYLFF